MIKVFETKSKIGTFSIAYTIEGVKPTLKELRELRDAFARMNSKDPVTVKVEVWGNWYGNIDHKEFADFSIHADTWRMLDADIATGSKWFRIFDHKNEEVNEVTTEGLEGIKFSIWDAWL